MAGATALVLAVALTACGGDGDDGSATDLDPSDWAAVLAAADGQTVDWYMYGGDTDLNSYVENYVVPEAGKLGVRVNQVRITDTVEAVNKVLGEKQAGRDDEGSVDLIWINGENFATGKQADLWYCGWPEEIPSAEYIDFADPSVAEDFGLPVEGCEAAWNRSGSVLVYDSAVLDDAATSSVGGLTDWVTANPGRFTYPAVPDFTGSMVVRTFFYDAAGGYERLTGEFDQGTYDEVAPRAWQQLNDLEPALWRGGETYPTAQTDVSALYANGEIDAFLTYGTGVVGPEIEKGTYRPTTRTAVFDEGTIGNVNFVAIPYNSPDKAGAMVLANLLQSPAAQYEKKANPPAYGTALDLERVEPDIRERFRAIPVPTGEVPEEEVFSRGNPELRSEWLTAIEKDWTANVLQQ